MFRHYTVENGGQRRPAAVFVFTMVTIAVLIGFAALTIDVGIMQIIRADLQRTADSAALAAVQDLSDIDPDSVDEARYTAVKFVAHNPILNRQTAWFAPYRDVVFGRSQINEDGIGVVFSPGDSPPNAVRVTVHYSFDYIFATIFGLHSKNISATAIAAVPPPKTVDVIPASLPVPGFGPVDPKVAEHNPGKTSPSEPANGERFIPGEEVAVFIFGSGPMPATHLVIDITESNGVAELNRLLATEESLGGAREESRVSIGDEYYVWGEGTGNGNFGEKLVTRLKDDIPENDTVILPVIEELDNTRNNDGELAGLVRVVDFVAVNLTEIREEEIPDPGNPGSTLIVKVVYANVVEVFSGTGDGSTSTSGVFTLGSVRTRPMLVM